MSNTNTSPDQYVIDGELYEKDSNGDLIRVINQSNIKAGDGVSIDKNENNEVVISSDLGLSIVNGQLCVSYEKEVGE